MSTRLKKSWRRWISKRKPKALRVQKTIVFRLSYGKTAVGTLTRRDGKWEFRYEQEFKDRHDLRPIVQFPDKNCVYEEEELWPFFELRIPSRKQPSIQRIIQKEKIDENDEAELLRRFGRQTISNPYELNRD